MNTPISITTGKPVGGTTKMKFGEFDKDSLSHALAHIRIEVVYDVRGGRVRIRRFGTQWDTMTERHEKNVRDELAKRCVKVNKNTLERPFWFSAERWSVALGALLHESEVDPFVEWLEELPPWDGVERIEKLLCDMFGAHDDNLNRWASGYLFRGAVHRAYRPGAKLDQMPVLVGGQGIGKSHLLAALLPPVHRDDWFNDSINLTADTQKLAEAMQGRVIVEASELAGLYRAEIEALKAFLSRRDDGGVRLAYRRDPYPMPRRAIIVGTTNHERCLPNDPTGLRRFVPVKLAHGCDVQAHVDPIRDQLWAEALAWWRGGTVTAALPRNLISYAAKVAEVHRSGDEIIEERIEGLDPTPMTLSEIMLATKSEPREQKRVTAALMNAGWESHRVTDGSRRLRKWCPPKEA